MSTTQGGQFLPPLDQCLAHTRSAIPWRVIEDQILRYRATDFEPIKAFLSDERNVAVLVNSLQPLNPSSQASKQEFETRTAPINVARGVDGNDAIETLKKDAIWLATQLDIDEVSALRICVIAWQQTSADAVAGKIDDKDSGAATLTDVARHGRLLRTFLEERSAAKAICAILTALYANEKAVASGTGQETWLEEIAEVVRTSRASQGGDFVSSAISECSKAIELLEDSKTWPACFQVDFSLHEVFLNALLQDLSSALRQLLTYLHHSEGVPAAENVLSWFRLMQKVTYFQNFTAASVEQTFHCEILQSLVALLSTAILKLSESISELDMIVEEVNSGVKYPRTKTYLQDDACIRELNLLMFEAATYNTNLAGPGIYTWSIISMYIRDVVQIEQEEIRQLEDAQDGAAAAAASARRGSMSRRATAMELKYDAVQDMKLGEARHDPPQYLARQAADTLGVYAVIAGVSRILSEAYSTSIEVPLVMSARSVLFDLVRESLPLVTYDEHVFEATLAILAPATGSQPTVSSGLISKFLDDRTRFEPLVLGQAISRYPYELTPLLQILNALSSNMPQDLGGNTITERITHMSSMTITLPENFRGYTLEHEEEGANAFRLLEDLPLFTPKPLLQTFVGTGQAEDRMILGTSPPQAQLIRRGTHGVILRDSKPFIVRLEHSHNGLHFLSLLLDTYSQRATYTVTPPAPSVDSGTCYEIIMLFKAMIAHSASADDATTLMTQMGETLSDGQDIIALIADILETELLSFTEQSGERSIGLLVSCMEFLIAVHKHSPDRLWFILSKSSLLVSSAGLDPITGVINATGDSCLPFIETFAKLYQAVLKNTVEGLVKRKQQTNRSTNGRRFDSPLGDVVESSERTVSQVLVAYTSSMTEVLRRLTTGQLLAHHTARSVAVSIMQSLHQLALAVYGVGSGSSHEITAMLKPAAALFLSTVTSKTPAVREQALSTITTSLDVTAQLLAMRMPSSHHSNLLRLANTTIALLTFLVRLSTDTSASQQWLAVALTRAMSTLATLYAIDSSLRCSVLELLEALVQGLRTDGEEPLSIFVHLPPKQGQHLLRLLGELDQPLQDNDTICRTWSLFSAACECGQQWFAMYVLTGILPRDRLTSGQKPAAQTSLSRALDLLVDIKNVAPEQALAMSRFVSQAQRLWIWATTLVRAHADFLKSIVAWLADLKLASRGMSPAAALLCAREYAIAASLCDIISVGIHAGLESGDRSIVKLATPKLGWLAEHAANTDLYNKVLHNKLAENVARRFSGLVLADFKRTSSNPGSLGRSYLYDLDLTSRALRHDGSWTGNGKRGSFGFEEEFTRANINWSLFDASVQLLAEWKILTTTLANSLTTSAGAQQQDLVTIIVTSISSCLDANLTADLDLPQEANIIQTRADIAFGLLSHLKKGIKGHSAHKEHLTKAYALIRASPVDFDVATATDDLTYYRTLLQIFLLTLDQYNAATSGQLKKSVRSNEEAISKADLGIGSLLVELVTRTISTGFRALCAMLHDDATAAIPSDFALLTALMQAVLESSALPYVSAQVADAIAFSGVIRSASSLYSWSDRLAEASDHDPAYGEISAMFLTTLSRVPKIAEQLALDGILTYLSSANLSDYFRKPGGRGPFDEPGRMFTIWSAAFLPLCINMLEAVGPPVASEISSFLNSFPQQLARAQDALVNASPNARNPRAGAVTLGLLTEARDLTLIAQVLKAAIELGAAEGIASSDIEELKYNAASVADDVDALTKVTRSLRDRIVPATRREAALFADKNASGHDNALAAAITAEMAQIKGLAVQDAL